MRKQQNEEACTSQSCKWNVPRKRKVDLVPIANMTFRKHEHAKMKKSREPVISPGHDVRPAKYRNTNANTNTKRYNTFFLCNGSFLISCLRLSFDLVHGNIEGKLSGFIFLPPSKCSEQILVLSLLSFSVLFRIKRTYSVLSRLSLGIL